MIVITIIVFITSVTIWYNDPWTLMPTKSSSHKLSLVLYDRFSFPEPSITLRHYVNNEHISDYVLDVKTGVQIQEPQSYTLPELNEGMVEVNIELGGNEEGSFTITYIKASDLYKRGLLIYLTTNNSKYYLREVDGKEFYDRYIYLVVVL